MPGVLRPRHHQLYIRSPVMSRWTGGNRPVGSGRGSRRAAASPPCAEARRDSAVTAAGGAAPRPGSAGHRSPFGRAGARRQRDRTGLEAPRRARPGPTQPGRRPGPAAAAGSYRRLRSPCHRLGGPSPAPPPGTPSVLAGEARSQGGGGGRDQAQGTSRQGPQGQGNGPEGERDAELYRSPDPGRQCPCGCPRPVVLSRRPRGPIRGCCRMGPHHYEAGARDRQVRCPYASALRAVVCWSASTAR